jgi:hypothetical protein
LAVIKDEFTETKKILDNNLCPFGYQENESVLHFAIHCQHTREVMCRLGIQLVGISDPEEMFTEAKEPSEHKSLGVGSGHYRSLLDYIVGEKLARVFADVQLPVEVVARQCAAVVQLWTFIRAKKKEKEAAKIWIAKCQSVDL